jgi:arsenate reductase
MFSALSGNVALVTSIVPNLVKGSPEKEPTPKLYASGFMSLKRNLVSQGGFLISIAANSNRHWQTVINWGFFELVLKDVSCSFSAMIKVYGLKNCDTCRKAVKELAAANIDHQFADFRKDGLQAESLKNWVLAVGWETLLNTRGTTWRGLNDADKTGVDQAKATALMLEHPALIKRPVFEVGNDVVIGYKDEQKKALGL